MTPSLRKELWRTPDLLGFAAHWTWIWCVFWSSLFYAEGTLLNSSGIYRRGRRAFDHRVGAAVGDPRCWPRTG